ncbi:MAG: hypothetical protein WCA84_04700 [Ignavibacteriaceae bacterium]
MHYFKPNGKQIIQKISITVVVFLIFNFNMSGGQKNKDILYDKINLFVTVVDSIRNTPLELVNLTLSKGKKTYRTYLTDSQGAAIFTNLEPGKYILFAHRIGYKDYLTSLVVDKIQEHLKILMIQNSIRLNEVLINGSKDDHVSGYIDTLTGNQVILTDTYHAPPQGSMIAFIQENVNGAVREPIGEMVIRDQHSEYSSSSYYLDGVPIPLGVLGDLDEIVNPEIVQRINIYTGGFPAEYGGQSTAVFDIQNRIPTGNFHLNLSTYVGSYLTSNNEYLGNKVGTFKALNSNGEDISLSNNLENFGYYLSVSRQETDRRLDQPVEKLFNDHGLDYFLYGKIDYLLGENDYITSNLNYSDTQTDIPFDSIEAIDYDTQNNYNAFQTLSYYHIFSNEPGKGSKILISLFSSERGIKYLTNNELDETRQYLGTDTTTSYTINQDRKYFSYGTRAKYSNSLSNQFEYEAGLALNLTAANEVFQLKDFAGNGPVINSNYQSSTFGMFFQTQIHPWDLVMLEAGIRYDQLVSPSIPFQTQVSPRLKLNLYTDGSNTIYLSYGRLFLPTNVEGLNYLSQIITGSTLNSGTYPERDNLYELGIIHKFNSSLTSKLDYFHKDASPGLDDETLGASSIKININVAEVKVSGLELSLNYNEPFNPFSFYINSSIMHGYGEGLISGGFLPSFYSSPYDLDHDQRLTLVTGLNYQPANYFINLLINYGSGLTNGNDDYDYKTGLFDFNLGAHTAPAWIINLSGGYIFNLETNHTLQPSLYITNLLDHAHLIKGAFFNSAYFEERRNVTFKLSYQI